MGKKLELLIALSDEILLIGIALFAAMYFLIGYGIIGVAEAILISAIVAAIAIFISYKIYVAHYREPHVGPEALVGRVGEVVESEGTHGVVLIEGELWRFESLEGEVSRGDRVVVKGVSGLTVKVKRALEE